MKRYIIGITGASGSILSKRLLEFMASLEAELHIIITDNGKQVYEYEIGTSWESFIGTLKRKGLLL